MVNKVLIQYRVRQVIKQEYNKGLNKVEIEQASIKVVNNIYLIIRDSMAIPVNKGLDNLKYFNPRIDLIHLNLKEYAINLVFEVQVQEEEAK